MPGFKTFTSATLSSADVNDYLMEQAVIQCTSGTRPSSPHEGMTIYETDTDLYKHYSGSAWVTLVQPGAWTSFTPEVKGSLSGAPTATLTGSSASRYCRIGRTIHWHGVAQFSGAPSGAIDGAFYFTLPVTADMTAAWLIGPAYGFDDSAVLDVHGLAYLVTTTQMAVRYVAGTGPTGSSTNLSTKTSELPWTWATNDIVRWSVRYEAAS